MKNFFKGGKKTSKPESRTQSRSLQMINAEDSDDDGGYVLPGAKLFIPFQTKVLLVGLFYNGSN